MSATWALPGHDVERYLSVTSGSAQLALFFGTSGALVFHWTARFPSSSCETKSQGLPSWKSLKTVRPHEGWWEACQLSTATYTLLAYTIYLVLSTMRHLFRLYSGNTTWSNSLCSIGLHAKDGDPTKICTRFAKQVLDANQQLILATWMGHRRWEIPCIWGLLLIGAILSIPAFCYHLKHWPLWWIKSEFCMSATK
jgi:hypothetical protein